MLWNVIRSITPVSCSGTGSLGNGWAATHKSYPSLPAFTKMSNGVATAEISVRREQPSESVQQHARQEQRVPRRQGPDRQRVGGLRGGAPVHLRNAGRERLDPPH